MPVLAPETYSKVYGFIAGSSGAKQKESATQLHPQILGDRSAGRDDRRRRRAYNKLPADERAQACIYTLNYGEAGAINFFGPQVWPATGYQWTQHVLALGAGRIALARTRHHHRLLAGGPGARVWLGDARREVYLYLLHAGGERPNHLRLPPAQGCRSPICGNAPSTSTDPSRCGQERRALLT